MQHKNIPYTFLDKELIHVSFPSNCLLWMWLLNFCGHSRDEVFNLNCFYWTQILNLQVKKQSRQIKDSWQQPLTHRFLKGAVNHEQ